MTGRRAWGLMVLVVAGMLVVSGAGWSAAQAPDGRKVMLKAGGGYTDVSAARLAAMLRQKAFPLINVHVPYEGEIAGTDLFVPFDQVERNLARLPADKGARIVLYCMSGRMSAMAAATLARLGYTDVWNLDGGMQAWRQAGFPLAPKAR